MDEKLMRCPTLNDLPPPPPGKTGWPWTEESLQLPDRMPDGRSWPRISIVTPSFNQGQFIEETIRSVLLQGYPDLEYIIIDGGSTDDSVEIIRQYEPWLAYWVSEKDDGQAHAINKGFSKATGICLGYLNSDDTYVRYGLITIMLHVVRGGELRNTLITAPVQNFFGESLKNRHINSRLGSIAEWLDGYVGLHQPGCLWSSDLWQLYGPFREDLHYIFEQYFFALCRIGVVKHMFSSDTLANFRLHIDSKTIQFLVEQNRFTPEWNSVKMDLENRLSPMQLISVKLSRNLLENWRLVSAALGDLHDRRSRKALFIKVLRNPLWLLHRPVASALFRIGFRQAALVGKRALSNLKRF